MFETIAFYFFAVMSLALFGVSVTSRDVLKAMTALAGGMIFISGFFFLLGAEFLGVTQIVVYTGAVIVLYAFAMMFFDANKRVKESKTENKLVYIGGFICAVLTAFIIGAPVVSERASIAADLQNTQAVGIEIFTKYLIVFELVAVMLLAVMIGAIVLVVKERNLGANSAANSSGNSANSDANLGANAAGGAQ